MNKSTSIVLVAVAVAVVAAICIAVRRHRRCRGACAGCAIRENCTKPEKDA